MKGSARCSRAPRVSACPYRRMWLPAGSGCSRSTQPRWRREKFAHRVRESVDREGVRVVVIDSLNGYMNAMPEERFLVLQMHELLSTLNQLGVITILVLAQHGLLGPMQTPLDMSYLSDAVLMLRYFEAEGRVRRAI